MGLSKMAAKCRACPYIDTYNHKELEAYGLLPYPPQNGSLVQAAKETDMSEIVRSIAGIVQVPEHILKGGMN